MSKCSKCGLEEECVAVTDLHYLENRKAIEEADGIPEGMGLFTFLAALEPKGIDRIQTCKNWCNVGKGLFVEQGDKGYE